MEGQGVFGEKNVNLWHCEQVDSSGAFFFTPKNQTKDWRAAKGGRQNGVGHSRFFRSLFGYIFLIFDHFLVTFSRFGLPFCLPPFAYPLLPTPLCLPPFCGMVKGAENSAVDKSFPGFSVWGLCIYHLSVEFFDGGFSAYSWKLPAYGGAFLLTVDNFSLFTYSRCFFAYSFSLLLTVGAFLLTVEKCV